MAKFINVGESFVLVEVRRDVNRGFNQLVATYELQIRYGVTYTKEFAEVQRTFVVNFDSSNYPALWDKYKDMTRDEVIPHLLAELVEFETLLKAGKDEELLTLRKNTEFPGLLDQFGYHKNRTPLIKNTTLTLGTA
jgi:hypothetical protein